MYICLERLILPDIDGINGKQLCMDYHQLKFQGEESMLELYFFADALGHAYGAAAYLQLKSSHKFKCSFVISKSRIAAIKQKNIS